MFIELGKEYLQLLTMENKLPADETQLVPDDFFQSILKHTLGRDYLSELANQEWLPKAINDGTVISWVKINRLPIHPSKIDEYNLLPRWQGALSTLHLLGRKLIFLLIRFNGLTSLYLGTNNRIAVNQLCQAVYGHMPGIELHLMEEGETQHDVGRPLMELNACGAVTGIPSPRKLDNYDMLQTLDQLAFGIRDYSGFDHNFAMIAIADPVSDIEISDLTSSILNVGTEISDKIQQNIQETSSEGINAGSQFNLGSIVGMMLSMVPGAGKLISAAGLGIGMITGLASSGLSKGKNSSFSKTVSKQYLNKCGQYCDEIIDKYIKRMEQGRNLGFWNTGVYILADTETTVNTAAGILRSVYSGEDTYIEPIRAHIFMQNSYAIEYVKRFHNIPYPYNEQKKEEYRRIVGNKENWHPLGRLFESVTTPLNTIELSIAMSLPRRDVPGVRFVRNAVRFAANPPEVKNQPSNVVIGNVMDTGVTLDTVYSFDVNTLTKHALVTGITGSGKSTTCRKLLSAINSKDIPFLIIEPAKEEYVAWAINENKKLSPEEKIHIYMPGAGNFDEHSIEALNLNPFEPSVADGGAINMTSRVERFKAAFNASMPMGDVLPLIIEEALYEIINIYMGPKFLKEEIVYDRSLKFPLMQDLPGVGDRILSMRGYDKEIESNIKAALRTRVNALTTGWKGDIFNVPYSTSGKDLYDRKVVINLNRIADDRDKSLIMSLLLISLMEYRESKYRFDQKYRKSADNGILCHTTVIEEAHRLLRNTGNDNSNGGNPQAVVSNMFCEMLSEIRAYGEGMLIVDQVPARLIPDAIKNTNLKIVHRIVAKDDRDALSSCMGLRQEQEDTIAILQQGQAIICGDNDDAASWVKINAI